MIASVTQSLGGSSAFEVWGLIISAGGLLAASVATIFAVLSWLTSRSSKIIAEESLKLGREQALMQPRLDVDCYVEPPEHEGDPTLLVVEIVNEGRTAATDIHGWIDMEADKMGPYVPPPRLPSRDDSFLESAMHMVSPIKTSWGSSFDNEQEPEDGFYQAQVWETDRLLPSVVRGFTFNVEIRARGGAEIRYHVVCAEGVDIEETIEIDLSASMGGGSSDPDPYRNP